MSAAAESARSEGQHNLQRPGCSDRERANCSGRERAGAAIVAAVESARGSNICSGRERARVKPHYGLGPSRAPRSLSPLFAALGGTSTPQKSAGAVPELRGAFPLQEGMVCLRRYRYSFNQCGSASAACSALGLSVPMLTGASAKCGVSLSCSLTFLLSA